MAEILRDIPSEGVVRLRINRPDVLNALSVSVRAALAQEVRASNADPDVRVIIIAGDDKVFAAGGDLAELQRRSMRDIQSEASRICWVALDDCRKPVIAAVNGFALGGGCELAFHCDIIIAGEGAKFGLPEVKVGIMPGAGGTQRLLRAAGHFKAARYLLTGDFIPAAIASEIGIVSEVVPDADVMPQALKVASKIAALPPLAVRSIKEVLRLGADVPLETAMSLERKAFQLLFATEDRQEGISAFLEKRQPVFKGR